jgi:nicotinamide-nucleotide amidase
VEAVRRALDPWVWGQDDETLAGLTAEVLKARSWTLASAERGMAGALAAEIAADERLMSHYRGGFVVSSDGAPLGVPKPDPAELATAVRREAGADVGIAAVLHTDLERPTAEFAVDVRGLVKAEPSRWNFRVPELRRRAAVEAMALLLNTLRAME